MLFVKMMSGFFRGVSSTSTKLFKRIFRPLESFSKMLFIYTSSSMTLWPDNDRIGGRGIIGITCQSMYFQHGGRATEPLSKGLFGTEFCTQLTILLNIYAIPTKDIHSTCWTRGYIEIMKGGGFVVLDLKPDVASIP
ncbi:hypothetical protein ABKN59_011341 [Abortiporus biennis]